MFIVLFQVINKIMYTGSADHTARAWVTEFGDCTRVYKGHKHSVAVVKFRDGLCKFKIFVLYWLYILFLLSGKPFLKQTVKQIMS